MTHWPVMGLVIFVAVFVGAAIWVATRSKAQVDHWSKLPLSEEKQS